MAVLRSTLVAVQARLDSARCPEEVFGGLAGSEAEQLAALRAAGRALMRSCHPDIVAPADKARATRMFQALGGWEGIAKCKIEDGTYGDFLPYVAPEPDYAPVDLQVRGRALRLTGLLAEGTFASVHRGVFEGEDAGQSVCVKYARDSADNDLLEREFRVLKTFQRPERDPNAEAFFQRQRVYVPCPLASFSLLDDLGEEHRTNVLSVPQGRALTAQTLRCDKFPAGIEPKHVWWIFRRLLLTLWMAHLKGFIHGAVTPDHVLIFPEAHGLVLLDWTCAAKIGEEHVPAINPEFEAFYPPETSRREEAAPSADLWMAASTALWMLGGDPATRQIPDSVPAPLRDALLDCLRPVASRRPQDAGRFHEQFGKLLGHRSYSPLIVP